VHGRDGGLTIVFKRNEGREFTDYLLTKEGRDGSQLMYSALRSSQCSDYVK
jgi:hypothetical protein